MFTLVDAVALVRLNTRGAS